MPGHNYWVYILFDKPAGATYIGVTNDLKRRVFEHKMELIPSFTQDKHIHNLGYFEEYKYIDKAIAREKALKKWKRAWKYKLIETMNPDWHDLASDIDEYIARIQHD